jgi:hypothetical protein
VKTFVVYSQHNISIDPDFAPALVGGALLELDWLRSECTRWRRSQQQVCACVFFARLLCVI